ncbi:MAG: histidinol-phosphate transaminase [Armatimonadota bacterium]
MPHQIRPNVLQMTPYVAGKPIEEVKRELGLDHVVKLASNENPLGPSSLAVEAVREAASRMHLYPDASGYELKAVLAAKAGLNLENVLVGNGSDELIHLLGLVLLQPGDQMVVGEPTFVRYAASADLMGVELVKVPLDKDLRHDVAAMAKAFTDKTKLVYVSNPHNPTGTVVTKQEVSQLVEALPSGATLVLDEAYFEYTDGLADMPDAIGYVKDGKRVVSLRTFSKAYGLAGIRVGYGFASADLVDAVNRAREPFDVNALAQVAGIAALGDKAHLQRSVEINQAGIARIVEAASKLGFHAVPSFANFVCIAIDRPGTDVFQGLLKKGIIIRPGEPLGLPNYIRVSVGTPDEIDKFIEAFNQVIA